VSARDFQDEKEAPRQGGDSDEQLEAEGQFNVQEIIRRMATVGLSGFFSTETAVRKALGETVPQDWIDFAAGQSERTRQEFMDRMIGEMAKVMQSMDVAEVLATLLEGRNVEVSATFKLGSKTDSSATEDESS
jgi:hypothetical protein